MTAKYLFFGLAAALAGVSAYFFSQEQAKTDAVHPACCAITAPSTFAAYGKEQDFVDLHLNPEALAYQAKGERISFKTKDGKDGGAYFIQAPKKSKKFLLVFHEWWGLNDYIKREADMWAEKLGVNVMAIDLYDGNVADTREKATEYMQATTTERAVAIVEGAIAHAGPKAKIATIGWCYGGSWSLQAAILAQKQAVGCVIYYGMPEKDVSRLKTLNCDVLGIFAGLEKRINPEVVAEFEKNMQTAGKGIKTKIYEAEHAFANPSNPRYNKEASEDAGKLALEYLKKRL